MAVLRIENIECYAFHGCLPAEGLIGQQYSVDVIIEGDFAEAVATDDLSKAVDYCLIHDLVRTEMQISSKLIEHVAGRILQKIKSNTTSQVTVRITKYNPPVNGRIEKVIFEISS